MGHVVAHVVTGEGDDQVKEDLAVFVGLDDGTVAQLGSGDTVPENADSADVQRLAAAGALEERGNAKPAAKEPKATTGTGNTAS